MNHVTAPDKTKPYVKDWSSGRPVVLMHASLKATLGCLKSFSNTDFRSDLAAFKVPTFVIHGTEDKTVPIGR